MHSVCNLRVVVFLLLVFALRLYGQNIRSITLSVMDEQSGIISSGEVFIKSSDGTVLDRKLLNQNPFLTFTNISDREILIEIDSPGFEPFSKKISVKDGVNEFTAKLSVRKIEEKVEITQSKLEQRLDQAFKGVLSRQEIDALPDDPLQIEKELKRRYGEDLVIRVNGFTGGRIPPKEAIRSIQVIMSGFDAEYHELGQPSANIITKASNLRLVGMIMFNYGNSVLNARNPFAPTKLPELNAVTSGFLSGPLKKGTSAFNFSFNSLKRTEQQTIVAKLPGESEPKAAKTYLSNQSFVVGVDHNLSSNNTVRLEFQNSAFRLLNAGVGGITLAERGFNVRRSDNELRLSLSGTLGENFIHQFRARTSFKKNTVVSNSQGVGITVSDTFSRGGAGQDYSSDVNRVDVFETISGAFGNHSVKVGGEARFEQMSFISSKGRNGNYFFNSLENYLLGKPSLYYRTDGMTNLKINRVEASLFAQDDLQISKRFQIGMGLRYEVQNLVADANNFSPRLSATVALDKNGKFILRTGAGILFQWLESDKVQRVLEKDGRQSSEVIINNPSFPFPNVLGDTNNLVPPSIYKRDPNLRNPYIFLTQTSLNISVNDGVRLSASYKFERGNHLFRSRDINSPINGTRPVADLSRITFLESSGIMSRNSLELYGEGVAFKRIRFNGRYRLSKSTDDFVDAFSLPSDSTRLRSDRGFSSLDQRHYLTGGFDYSPFKSFNLNSNFIISSPTPYTITTGLDSNGDFVFNDRPPGFTRNTARGAWNQTTNMSASWSIPLFKRNISVTKNSKTERIDNIPESLKKHALNISFNVNNLFNSTNKIAYVGNRLSPLYGQPTASLPARSISFALMFLYF